MKKKFLYSIVLFTIVGLSSCSKWLTVEPPTQTTADKLFQTSEGFSDALTGLYMGLRSNYKPDQFMMSGGVDNMACLYSTGGDYSGEHALYLHNYANSYADQKMNTGFLNQYKVIANANILLDAVKDQTILRPDFAKLVEGEAVAVRAFAHFDLIRLWGPIPSLVQDSSYLPYVLHKQTTPYAYDTYQVYMGNILADLNRAEELLKEVDPILKYSNSELNVSNPNLTAYPETYWYYRQNRVNYYAVLALKARYYLWVGNNSEAFRYAKMVIEAKNDDGSNKFLFADRNTFSSTKDYTMFSEQIAGIHVETFDDAAFSGSRPTIYNTQENINTILFGGTTDLRKATFLASTLGTSQEPVMLTLKFSNMRLNTYTSSFSIPLIRLSELYLIVAETADIDIANQYYSTYLAAKEAPAKSLQEDSRKAILLTEYIRELYGEGQAFYVYKRMNSPSMFFTTEQIGEKQYVPTLPVAEINPFN